MFTVYFFNSNTEALALTPEVDASQVHHFDHLGVMLDFIRNTLGTTGYRVNDDMEVEPFQVESYRVLDNGLDITAEVPAALARRATEAPAKGAYDLRGPVPPTPVTVEDVKVSRRYDGDYDVVLNSTGRVLGKIIREQRPTAKAGVVDFRAFTNGSAGLRCSTRRAALHQVIGNFNHTQSALWRSNQRAAVQEANDTAEAYDKATAAWEREQAALASRKG